ncbi:fimbrial protein [Pseudomonas chlororaphis]|uniref:fimbrial protein n=1 Tax=Pseudomonas chlororaphis TaxID=587753 RepID=UPI0023685660|nr:fimbrial protein [Pseudomonas chlororaphis]WDG77615.1 fimbrial protein [Pseudomonas chlororaphis]WDG83148.1 fimbrial protein [Pseudomonas chlororaphis]
MKSLIPYVMFDRRPYAFALGLGMIGPDALAAAQCTLSGPTRVDFGNISIGRDLANGSPVGRPVTLNVLVNCPPSGGASGWDLQAARPNYITRPSETVADTWTRLAFASVLPYSVKITSNSGATVSRRADYNSFGSAPQDFKGSYSLTFQLYKQESKQSWGDLDGSTEFVQLHSYNNRDGTRSRKLLSYTFAGTVNQQVATCSITTPSIPVDLLAVPAHRFSTDKTAGDKPFVIGLTCPDNIRLFATLTDASTPGNTSELLSLAPGSTASGVQLRILRNGIAQAFGPDSPALGNTNQWEVGWSSGSVQIPLTAQYISTEEVKPGTVKGVATFTMSYQ